MPLQNEPTNLVIPRLDCLYFYLTSYCNLNCIHCWLAPTYLDKGEAPEEASFELLKDIINQALPLGLGSIKISGGEPFLNKNILPLISYAFNQHLNIDIETNATLIDYSIAGFLKQNSVRLVAVSLDGPSQKIHEAMRGKQGCFSQAIEGILLLKKYGLNVQAIMSLYKGNIGYLEETVDLLESYGVDSFKINCISKVSRGQLLKRKNLTLTVADYLKVNKIIDEKIQPRHKIRIIFDLPPAFQKIEAIKKLGACGIKGILGVLPDARISICGIGEVLPSLILGDIRKDSLADIWKNGLILKAIREDLPRKLEGVCAACIFKAYCLGKCRAEAYYLTNSILSSFSFCEEAFQSGLFPQQSLINRRLMHEKVHLCSE